MNYLRDLLIVFQMSKNVLFYLSNVFKLYHNLTNFLHDATVIFKCVKNIEHLVTPT